MKYPHNHILSDYTAKELLGEVYIRFHRKVKKLPSPYTESYDVRRNKKEEAKFVRSLPTKATPSPYSNERLTTTQRFAEKVWWWITDNKTKTNGDWAQKWIEKHPADTVGLKNVINREAWLKKTLKKIPAGHKILDAGAGELQYKKFCKHLNYVSQDFGQYTGEGDQAALQMGSWDNSKLDIVSDITNIPVQDASFDAVMCIEVFEHIPKPIDAIRELSRVLKPGGQIVITAPFSSLVHFAPYYFYNGYSRYFYETILPEHGFEVKEVTMNGNYFEYVAQEVRRIEDMATRYAPKGPKKTVLDDVNKQHILRRLEELSATDLGSNEFAAHGLHVVATKK